LHSPLKVSTKYVTNHDPPTDDMDRNVSGQQLVITGYSYTGGK